MSSAFDLIQGSKVFTKLYLGNAYHFICILMNGNLPLTPTGLNGWWWLLGLLTLLQCFREWSMIYFETWLTTFNDILILTMISSPTENMSVLSCWDSFKNHMFVKTEKCGFHLPYTSFSGFIISVPITCLWIKVKPLLLKTGPLQKIENNFKGFWVR